MKSPSSESRKEVMAPTHREGQDRPAWIADGSLEGEIAGTLWSRLAKGLLKDHVGRVQVRIAFKESLVPAVKRMRLYRLSILVI
jgi:hypothetical protein